MDAPHLTINIEDPAVHGLVSALVRPMLAEGRIADDVLKQLEDVTVGVVLTLELMGGAQWAADRLHCGIKNRLASAMPMHPAATEERQAT